LTLNDILDNDVGIGKVRRAMAKGEAAAGRTARLRGARCGAGRRRLRRDFAVTVPFVEVRVGLGPLRRGLDATRNCEFIRVAVSIVDSHGVSPWPPASGHAAGADARAIAPAGRATMRDVAALAGVSLKTVSRVVNGATTVDADLAARCAAPPPAELPAQHDREQPAARDRRSFMIGLMLEDVSNPYSSSVYRAVENVARERGVGLLAGSLDEDPVRERELASTLVARRVDGLIIVPAGRDHSYLRDEQEVGTAVVFVDRRPRSCPPTA